MKKFDEEDKYDAKVAAYESLDLLTFLPVELEYPENADVTPGKVNHSIFVQLFVKVTAPSVYAFLCTKDAHSPQFPQRN